MRASQGIPHGPKARPYHPELFQNHEEVIVYEREEFKRNFKAMRNSIGDIFLMYLGLDAEDDFMLLGQWPRIMEKIHIINLELNSFFNEKPVQCCLDTYMHNPVKDTEQQLVESLSNQSIESMGLDWL